MGKLFPRLPNQLTSVRGLKAVEAAMEVSKTRSGEGDRPLRTVFSKGTSTTPCRNISYPSAVVCNTRFVKTSPITFVPTRPTKTP